MLPDLLTTGLKVVFCGTAAGKRSAELKQYYAGKGNKFWKTIYEIGLTPTLLRPNQYNELSKYDIGLTDLVKNKSGMDKILLSEDFGSELLVQKVKKYNPKWICFNGKRAGKEFLLREVDYGVQSECVDLTRLFVASSTSSAASGFWDIDSWHLLAKLCNE